MGIKAENRQTFHDEFLTPLRNLRHKIAHWFGWNTGAVATWHGKHGVLMVGFKCGICKKVSGVEKVPTHIFPFNKEYE